MQVCICEHVSQDHCVKYSYFSQLCTLILSSSSPGELKADSPDGQQGELHSLMHTVSVSQLILYRSK